MEIETNNIQVFSIWVLLAQQLLQGANRQFKRHLFAPNTPSRNDENMYQLLNLTVPWNYYVFIAGFQLQILSSSVIHLFFLKQKTEMKDNSVSKTIYSWCGQKRAVKAFHSRHLKDRTNECIYYLRFFKRPRKLQCGFWGFTKNER